MGQTSKIRALEIHSRDLEPRRDGKQDYFLSTVRVIKDHYKIKRQAKKKSRKRNGRFDGTSRGYDVMFFFGSRRAFKKLITGEIIYGHSFLSWRFLRAFTSCYHELCIIFFLST